MKSSKSFDVIIAGNGPAGMAAALAYDAAGFAVALAGPERQSKDLRTTALMVPAIHLLERLGVWDAIKPYAAPLRAMQIIDGTNRLIRALPVTFQASEIGEDAFGWNMPNEALLSASQARLDENSAIQQYRLPISSYVKGDAGVACTLENGKSIDASLVIAADGRGSMAREAAGIKVKSWSYPQIAMVLAFTHSRAHSNVSTEFHTETGPFTLVPLAGKRSSLVWAMRPQEVDAFKALDDAALSLRVEQKMHSMLGKIDIDTPRQFYPLSGQTPEKFAAHRIMLVGEAAHVFPPIGAQGLNLGLRDVEEAVTASL